MDKEIKFIAREGFAIREIAGTNMLVPVNTGTIHLDNGTILPEFNGIAELNDLGLFLYETLSRPKTFSQLVEAVKSEYDTEGQNVEGDIEEFIDKGIRNQLIFIVARGKEEKRNEKL